MIIVFDRYLKIESIFFEANLTCTSGQNGVEKSRKQAFAVDKGSISSNILKNDMISQVETQELCSVNRYV